MIYLNMINVFIVIFIILKYIKIIKNKIQYKNYLIKKRPLIYNIKLSGKNYILNIIKILTNFQKKRIF